MKHIKRFFALFFVVALCLSLYGCGAPKNETSDFESGSDYLPWALTFDWTTLPEKRETLDLRGHPLPLKGMGWIADTYNLAIVYCKDEGNSVESKLSIDDLGEFLCDSSFRNVFLYRGDTLDGVFDVIAPIQIEPGETIRFSELMETDNWTLSSVSDLTCRIDTTQESELWKSPDDAIKALGRPDAVLPMDPILSDDVESNTKDLVYHSAGVIAVWQYDGYYYAVSVLDAYLDPDWTILRVDETSFGFGAYTEAPFYEGYMLPINELSLDEGA